MNYESLYQEFKFKQMIERQADPAVRHFYD